MKSKLKYPIGKFTPFLSFDEVDLPNLISEINHLPEKLKDIVFNISKEEAFLSYREDGWTVYQLVHHIADSHINGYIRTKFALQQDEIEIMPYRQDFWANTTEVRWDNMVCSLHILKGIHARWVDLFENLNIDDWKRKYHHPEMGLMPLFTVVQQYAWHGEHHLQHILLALNSKK